MDVLTAYVDPEWHGLPQKRDFAYEGSEWETMGFDPYLCPVCGSHLLRGICVKGCHLGTGPGKARAFRAALNGMIHMDTPAHVRESIPDPDTIAKHLLYWVDEAGSVVPASSDYEWLQWMRGYNRELWRAEWGNRITSTVFLGMNVTPKESRPTLFRVFNMQIIRNEIEIKQRLDRQYHTLESALKGHIIDAERWLKDAKVPDAEKDAANPDQLSLL